MPARAMRRAFADTNCRKVIMPSSNASSKTAIASAGHAGGCFSRTACEKLAPFTTMFCAWSALRLDRAASAMQKVPLTYRHWRTTALLDDISPRN
jgi:hypothetical protein